MPALCLFCTSRHRLFVNDLNPPPFQRILDVIDFGLPFGQALAMFFQDVRRGFLGEARIA